MKNQYGILLAMCFGVLLFSNFSERSGNTINFVFTAVDDEPVLPEIPYVYSGTEMPEHFFNAAPDVGYTIGFVDPDALNFIEDDIATLGRVLFYDEKLSALESISCGSCHNQADSFAEQKDFSEGVSSLTKRNSMHLNDLGWTNNTHFLWDLREENLNSMIRLPLLDENEIGADMNDVILKLGSTEYYPELFTKAFGNSAITEQRIVDALVHFISSMTTFNSKFDKEAPNEFEGFTDLENDGRFLFGETCGTCHTEGFPNPFFLFGDPLIDTFDSTMFSSNDLLEFFPFMFHNGMESDPQDAGAGEWNEGFHDLFKVPTLRNIELTGPYMHDGRFSTIEEVINHYSEDTRPGEWDAGLIFEGGFQFDQYSKDALKAFLLTLTDETFTEDVRFSDPFDSSVSVVNNNELEGLMVMPNPMSSYATIKFNNPLRQQTNIKVYGTDGSLLSTDSTTGQDYIIYKNDFPPGMYMIRISQGNKVSTQKLMVK